jgi:hypothetical protein
MKPGPNFKAKVLKALYDGLINKEEAKELIKKGFDSTLLPLFWPEENDPKNEYLEALKKMGLDLMIF